MISPTRINLIDTKQKTELASRGHEILKKKQEVLVIEFMKPMNETQKDRGYLYSILQPAYEMITLASAYIGTFELEEVAMHMREVKPVGLAIRDVMGVKVPSITMSGAQEGNTYRLLSTSVSVDDIRGSFAEVMKTLIAVAQREQGLRRLVLEIEKTKRRVNALEYVVVPDLKSTSKYIEMRLDEMDRDMFSALKHVKKKIAEKAELEQQAAA
jgi:V/A-type H+-transporting ATPase subunit D